MVNPLSEIATLDEAIQQALEFDFLRNAIAFICQWEEYHKNQREYEESCYGTAVAGLLRAYGIDVDKIARR